MTKDVILANFLGIQQSGNVSYSNAINAFVGQGFTSTAGNHYFAAIRLTDGIIIKEDIGQGYARTFLNGLKIYNLRDKTLIADETFHCQFYTTEIAKKHAKRMLIGKLEEASKMQGFSYDKMEAEQTIEKLVWEAFHGNQNDMAKCTVLLT